MTPERWKKIESLFESALERDPAERAAFLDRECGADDEMRQEVESLLAHQQPTGRFISTLAHDAAKLISKREPVSVTDSRFIPGTILASRYRIVGLLGRGGMGEVYRADDLKLAQAVALKFLPENLAGDRNMLARFHKEVRIARQISHPNVCRVFDIGEIEGQHFLSMEYIDGEDLASLLRRIGRLPSGKAVEIAKQLCAGLAAAHDEGVLHRDLKPANIMIDGRGKTRITDFGLAGLAEDFHGHEVRAGTPAYMAPEQLAGNEVTTKSDIYSLGLLLYEIFTGRKAFEAATLEELIKLRESSTPPSLSSYVKEVDPLVERIILRCLEREPRDRPATVAQISAALPGGDPLAAAIAAGETPSPEMVAAAPKEGALKPAVAVGLLATIMVLMGFLVLLSETVKLTNVVPMEKSPEILAERASNIVKKLGYESPPVDKAYGFGLDTSYIQYADENDDMGNLSERLTSGRPAVIYFWYRQSPRYMETFSNYNVRPYDPPMDVSGMLSVYLDTRGRLAEFQAVPQQVDNKQGTPTAVDWSRLFEEAELDIAGFKQSESIWLPPTGYDTRIAWEGAYPDQPDIPIRIEAAAYQGKPVYFQIIAPWERPSRQVPFQMRTGEKVAGTILVATFFAGLIGAVLIAWRNLRLERGDRKGAFKIALFTFSLVMLGSLINADHVPTLGGELNVLYGAVAWALFLSAMLWVIYIALEPYIRRRWPRLIISWSRLLAGGYRDPMVGRDILIGGILGLGHTVVIYVMERVPGWYGRPGPPNAGADPNLQGVQTLISNFVSSSVVSAIFFGLGYFFLLLLFYALLRKQWLAALAIWLIQVSISGFAFASSGPWHSWLGVFAIATLYTIASTRFGLLAVMSLQIFFTLSFHYPITGDFSSWNSGTTVFVLIIVIGLAVYGFYTSLAGQPLFRSRILHD
jgi:hypothetical protein